MASKKVMTCIKSWHFIPAILQWRIPIHKLIEFGSTRRILFWRLFSSGLPALFSMKTSHVAFSMINSHFHSHPRQFLLLFENLQDQFSFLSLNYSSNRLALLSLERWIARTLAMWAIHSLWISLYHHFQFIFRSEDSSAAIERFTISWSVCFSICLSIRLSIWSTVRRWPSDSALHQIDLPNSAVTLIVRERFGRNAHVPFRMSSTRWISFNRMIRRHNWVRIGFERGPY